MKTSKQKLREHLERIESPELRKFISECLAVTGYAQTGKQIPRKKYRSFLAAHIEQQPEPPTGEYPSLSNEELRVHAQAQTEDKEAAVQNKESVQLIKLELTNFGSFYGTHDIDLSSDSAKGKNTTVFVGSNGAGKSTTFSAINWALFATEYLKDLRDLTGKSLVDLINTQAIEETRNSQANVEASVTLTFEANETRYRISRSVAAHFLADGTVSPNEPQAQLCRIVDGNFDNLNEKNDLPSILRDIPRTAREFYLFDGERVNQFTAEDSRSRIRAAIEKIIGMDAINDTLEEMLALQKEIKAELKRTNTDEAFQKAANELEVLEEEFAKLEDEIASGTSTFHNYKRLIAKLDQQLKNTVDTSELQAQRDELNQRSSNNEANRKTTLEALQNTLADTYSCLALPALNEFAADLQQLQAAGALNGGMNAGFLRDLLSEDACVCGSPLGHGSEARSMLEQKLQAIEQQSPADSSLLELRYKIPEFNTLLQDNPALMADRIKSYAHLWEERAKLKDQLKAVSEQLTSNGSSNHAGWELERRQAEEGRDKTLEALAVAKAKLGEVRTKRTEAENQVTKLAAKNDKTGHLNNELGWISVAIETLQAIDKEFATIARMEATDRTVRLWNKLLPNVAQYTVDITDEFEMVVISKSGSSGMSQLSMGQRQCLGLAFITAIAQVAGTKPPIIIDMPFGKLAGNVATELAENLPVLADQLILFLLPDTEWNEATRKALSPNIRRVVDIRQDQYQVSHYEIEGVLG